MKPTKSFIFFICVPSNYSTCIAYWTFQNCLVFALCKHGNKPSSKTDILWKNLVFLLPYWTFSLFTSNNVFKCTGSNSKSKSKKNLVYRVQLQIQGNRWSAIASYLPNRTDNEIKNYWNTHIKRRLAMMGIDPSTHRPMVVPVGSANGDPKKVSNLTHMAQWESARLEAGARLVKESSKLGRNHLPPSGLKWRLPTQRFDKPRCLDILKAWQRVVDGNNGDNYNAGDLSDDIASFHSNEGLLQGCGDQTWNTGNCNADDQDLNLIKGYSNLVFNSCESDRLVHANMDNDDENMSYWDDIFNLVDCEATSK